MKLELELHYAHNDEYICIENEDACNWRCTVHKNDACCNQGLLGAGLRGNQKQQEVHIIKRKCNKTKKRIR